MAWQKTVYSSRGASIEGDEWDEPSFEDCALDEAVVIVDDGARYAAYEATWTVLPEEKRLDLQNHGRIGQSETGDGALQGLDDLCTLFDDGDGYDDASIDLGGNRLGTLGVEEVAGRWRDARGSGHYCPAPPLTVFVAENILRNSEWGFSGLSVADNDLGVRSQLGLARFAECLRDRFGTRFGHALVHLDLSGNTLLGVGGHRMLGMKELVKCMRRVDKGAGTLRHLNLSRNELHHEGARFLAEMLDGPGLEALEVLDVSDNYLCTSAAGVPTDAGFEIFAQAVRHHGALTALDVSRNAGFGDEASEALLAASREGVAGLRHLRLGGNGGCGARCCRHVGAALCLSRTLTDVDLCDLDVPRASLFDLIDCLPTATSITALDLSGNARAFVWEDAADLSLTYRADPARKLLEGVRRNTSLLTLRLCRLEIDGVGPDPAALGAVARSLVANACLPKLIANPFKWPLADAGDAKWELLRKFKYLDANEAKKLRSNRTICGDADARTVLDAVAPPSFRALMTNDPASLRKLDARNPYRKFAARRIQLTWFAHGHAREGQGPVDYATHMTPEEAAYEQLLRSHRAEKGGGRASVTDLATRKSNFWGKHVGPHRRASQKQGAYPQRKHTVGPHRRESQRSGMYPGDDGYDPGQARDVHNVLDPRATALARMADGEIWSRINVGTPPNDAGGGG